MRVMSQQAGPTATELGWSLFVRRLDILGVLRRDRLELIPIGMVNRSLAHERHFIYKLSFQRTYRNIPPFRLTHCFYRFAGYLSSYNGRAIGREIAAVDTLQRVAIVPNQQDYVSVR